MTIEMDPHNRLGEAVYLDPPVTVDGTQYSLALRFLRQGHQSVALCSAAIFRVDDLGGGVKRVVFARAAQVSAITVVEAPGVSYELVQTHHCGGNMCPSPEPFRIFSYNNDRAFCGGEERDRLHPGDTLQVTVGGVTGRYLVKAVAAFGDEPSSVDYSSPDALPTHTYPHWVVAPYYEYEQPAGDEELVQDSAAGAAYSDAGFGWWDGSTEGSKTFLQRVEFTPAGARVTSPYTGSDPDWYPTDAAFSTSAGQFWYDPVGRRCIIGSYVAGLSPAAWWVVWYVRTDELRAMSYVDSNGSTLLRAALTGMGAGLDVGGSSDQVALAVEPQGDVALDYVVQVFGASGAAAGDCGVLVAAADMSSWIAVDYSGSGWQLYYRDGTVTAGATLAPGAAFEVRFLRSGAAGDTWDVEWRLVGGGGWTSLVSGLSLDLGTSVVAGAYAASGAWIWWAPTVASGLGEWTHQQVGTTGTSWLGIRHTDSDTAAADFGPLTYTLPSAEAIDEVVNLSTYPDNTTMSQSATAARDHYGFSGGQVTLYPEGALDRVRVTQEAPATPTAGPGPYPPVLSGAQLNMSTDGGTVGQNMLNWRDYVDVYDPRDELDGGAEGATGSGARDAVFDPTDPPDLYVSEANLATPSWTAVPGASVYWFAEEGLALVTAAWVSANLVVGRRYTWRWSGPAYQCNGGLDANTHNQVAGCFDAADEGWCVGGTLGAGGSLQYNILGSYNTVITGLSGAVPPTVTAYGRGVLNQELLDLNPAVVGIGAYPACGPIDSSGNTRGWDHTQYPIRGPHDAWQGATAAGESDGWLDFGSGSGACDHTLRGQDALYWQGTDQVALGGPAVTIAGVQDALVADNWSAGIHAAGVPLGLAGFWTRVPAGAEIVEAWAEVMVPSQSIVHAEKHGRMRMPRRTLPNLGTDYAAAWSGMGTYGYDRYENGTLARAEWWTWNGSTWDKTTDTTNTPPASAGASFPLAWGLVGRRRHTRRLVVPDKYAYGAPVPAYSSLGSHEVSSLGVSAPITMQADGVYRQIDLTAVFQTLVDDRQSLRTEYYLFPTFGGDAEITAFDNTGFASLVRATAPKTEVELLTGSGGEWGTDITYTGVRTLALTVAPQFGPVLVRWRMPGGAISDPVPVPLRYPRTNV